MINSEVINLLEQAKREFNADDPSILRDAYAFNRFRIKYPDHELEKTTTHIFFTKPDLNILEDGGEVLTLQAKNLINLRDILRSKDIEIVKNLKLNIPNSIPLMYLIHNYAESIDLSDTTLKTRTSAETSTGWKLTYGGRSNESKCCGNFSIKYRDNRNLSIYKLHMIWGEYIDAISLGSISPKRMYILKRIIDYAVSAFVITVAEDGRTIIHFSKFIGVIPTNIPDSAFSWNKGDTVSLEYNIQYSYSAVEHMSPLIIKDFNKLCSQNGSELPIYNTKTGTMGTTWASSPHIREKFHSASTFSEYVLDFFK